MVNLRLTPVQRLGDQAHNCKVDNYEGLWTGRCDGQCPGLLVEMLGCKAWVKDLARSLCFVLGKTLYFHSTSDSPQEY